MFHYYRNPSYGAKLADEQQLKGARMPRKSARTPLFYAPRIGKTKPTLDFSGKAAFCLQNLNALYMILKTPVNSKGIKLSFFSHAEISTKWGGVFPTTSKPKGEESYELNF